MLMSAWLKSLRSLFVNNGRRRPTWTRQKVHQQAIGKMMVNQLSPIEELEDRSLMTDPTGTAGNSTVIVNEADMATNFGTYADLDNDPLDLSASVGAISNNDDGTWSWAYETTDGPDQSATVTIFADDG